MFVKNTSSFMVNSDFCASTDRIGKKSTNQISFFIQRRLTFSFQGVKKIVQIHKGYPDNFFRRREIQSNFSGQEFNLEIAQDAGVVGKTYANVKKFVVYSYCLACYCILFYYTY